MKGPPRQSQNFLSRFHHSSSFHSNDSLAQIAFCGVRRECGLQREDQQDDDEDRAGEESDGGPLAAV